MNVVESFNQLFECRSHPFSDYRCPNVQGIILEQIVTFFLETRHDYKVCAFCTHPKRIEHPARDRWANIAVVLNL